MFENKKDELKEIIRTGLLFQTDLDNIHVYRGQSDFEWEFIPSFYRRLLKNNFKKEEINEELIREFETDLLAESNGVGEYQGDRLTTLVKMQHHGGATRFLDVSKDFFVSLWFASDKTKNDNDGIIRHYAVKPEAWAPYEKIKTLDTFFKNTKSGLPILYFPNSTNDEPRIMAQKSGFLLTNIEKNLAVGTIFEQQNNNIKYNDIRIPSYLKDNIREYLMKIQGIDKFKLFPDFDGFSNYNTANDEFRRNKNKLYGAFELRVATRRMGIEKHIPINRILN